MTPTEAVQALDALNEDPDTRHRKADQILLAVVPPEVADAWHRAEKRLIGGEWWYS